MDVAIVSTYSCTGWSYRLSNSRVCLGLESIRVKAAVGVLATAGLEEIGMSSARCAPAAAFNADKLAVIAAATAEMD